MLLIENRKSKWRMLWLPTDFYPRGGPQALLSGASPGQSRCGPDADVGRTRPRALAPWC
jgi:hypothetical protein